MLFTTKERIFLLKLIRDNKHILFSTVDGMQEKKREAWTHILMTMRANGIYYNRDVMYLRYTTWMNLKRTTLRKLIKQKMTPTIKESLSTKDRLVLEILENSDMNDVPSSVLSQEASNDLIQCKEEPIILDEHPSGCDQADSQMVRSESKDNQFTYTVVSCPSSQPSSSSFVSSQISPAIHLSISTPNITDSRNNIFHQSSMYHPDAPTNPQISSYRSMPPVSSSAQEMAHYTSSLNAFSLSNDYHLQQIKRDRANYAKNMRLYKNRQALYQQAMLKSRQRINQDYFYGNTMPLPILRSSTSPIVIENNNNDDDVQIISTENNCVPPQEPKRLQSSLQTNSTSKTDQCVEAIQSSEPGIKSVSDTVNEAKADYFRILAHKAKLEILQLELEMKLKPRYSLENGMANYYSVPSTETVDVSCNAEVGITSTDTTASSCVS